MNAAEDPSSFRPTRMVGTLQHGNSVGWHEGPPSDRGLHCLPVRQLYF
jgi:hypothetical protein